jgi:Acetyltransferases, including N-acetylases of ribosomal proteins
MMEGRFKFRNGFHLSSVQPNDKFALLEHFKAKEIYLSTLNIPYPYSEADADQWLNRRIENTQRHGKEVTFAIRKDDEEMIGAVGADSFEVGASHRAEIGYWLARPYWGQGIMTDAVRAYVQYAFDELKLLRLTAHVFESNVGSARVLEKNGFKLEGRLRKHFRKEEKLYDAYFFGLLKEDV